MGTDEVLVSARPVAGVQGPPGGLYTPIAGVDALQAKQRTEGLANEVLRFARAPHELLERLSGRSLVLFRPMATPSFETLRFLELARAAYRQPTILELSGDWFTPTVNPSKRRLAKLAIERPGQQGSVRSTRSVSIASFNDRGRVRLRDLTCLNGQPFRHFHHRLLEALAGPAAREAIIDATAFYSADTPREHYERAFALYTCFGALAESFAFSGLERAFTEEVILPAFEATVQRFGARPAIVELLPPGQEIDPYWESYPAEALPFALRASGR